MAEIRFLGTKCARWRLLSSYPFIHCAEVLDFLAGHVIIYLLFRRPVAQLVEQVTLNHQVVGSSPTGPIDFDVTGNPRPAAGRGFRISAHIFRRCSTRCPLVFRNPN